MVGRIPTGEALRSAHIKTLAAMSVLEDENETLKAQLAEYTRPGGGQLPPRYKQEELDSLYVEERRQIESLQAELEAAKAAKASAQRARESETHDLREELSRLRRDCAEGRARELKASAEAEKELLRVRGAYADELAAAEEATAVALKRAREAETAWSDEKLRCKSVEAELSMAQARMKATSDSNEALAEIETKLRQAMLELTSMQHLLSSEKEARDEATTRAMSAEARADAALADVRRLRAAEAAKLEETTKEQTVARERIAHLVAALEKERSRREAAETELAALRKANAELQEELRALRTASRERPSSGSHVHPVPGDQKTMFTEFVQLKREIASLKALNEKLTRQVGSGLSSRELLPGAPPPEPISAILERHRQEPAGRRPQLPVPKLSAAASGGFCCGEGGKAEPGSVGHLGGLHGALPVGRRSLQRNRLNSCA